MRRAREGDTGAYGSLLQSHQDLIYGLVFRMVRDAAVAEELTQDVFVKAYRRLDSFRGEARFATWLYRIAVNACHDHRASQAARAREREVSLDEPRLGGLDPAAPAPTPDAEVEAGELAAHFEAGLVALKDEHRTAFLLRHEEGLGYEEIAGILGISVSNAKVRVHRAREKILETLRARGFNV